MELLIYSCTNGSCSGQPSKDVEVYFKKIALLCHVCIRNWIFKEVTNTFYNNFSKEYHCDPDVNSTKMSEYQPPNQPTDTLGMYVPTNACVRTQCMLPLYYILCTWF